MIPTGDLAAWRHQAPWKSDYQVEQDLIICRAVVELFSQPLLREHLAFRGGTALHKLHLAPPTRYSEDIDLVQVQAGPHGAIMDAIRNALDEFLGEPRRAWGAGSTTLTYRITPEGGTAGQMRLKVEINTREHFTVLGLEKRPFAVESRWFAGQCEIPTYQLDELLGTKLRALYQRRKGRDLFDLWLGIAAGKAKPAAIVDVYREYMAAEKHEVSRKDFQENLAAKIKDRRFLGDTETLLRADIVYDHAKAHRLVDEQLLSLL